jgi:hypothetical protein
MSEIAPKEKKGLAQLTKQKVLNLGTMIWPEKNKRELLEINGFIENYSRLPHGRKLDVAERGECPDYFLIDTSTGDRFGVELTSVYSSDKSVVKYHIPDQAGPVEIKDDPQELELYKSRLVKKVSEKIEKAKKYELTAPLILSIYVNEYISIYLSVDDIKDLIKKNSNIFDAMQPFSEIVFWSLPNSGICSVRIASPIISLES